MLSDGLMSKCSFCTCKIVPDQLKAGKKANRRAACFRWRQAPNSTKQISERGDLGHINFHFHGCCLRAVLCSGGTESAMQELRRECKQKSQGCSPSLSASLKGRCFLGTAVGERGANNSCCTHLELWQQCLIFWSEQVLMAGEEFACEMADSVGDTFFL